MLIVRAVPAPASRILCMAQAADFQGPTPRASGFLGEPYKPGRAPTSSSRRRVDGFQYVDRPPERSNVWPVVKVASAEARKLTAAATS